MQKVLRENAVVRTGLSQEYHGWLSQVSLSFAIGNRPFAIDHLCQSSVGEGDANCNRRNSLKSYQDAKLGANF